PPWPVADRAPPSVRYQRVWRAGRRSAGSGEPRHAAPVLVEQRHLCAALAQRACTARGARLLPRGERGKLSRLPAIRGLARRHPLRLGPVGRGVRGAAVAPRVSRSGAGDLERLRNEDAGDRAVPRRGSAGRRLRAPGAAGSALTPRPLRADPTSRKKPAAKCLTPYRLLLRENIR